MEGSNSIQRYVLATVVVISYCLAPLASASPNEEMVKVGVPPFDMSLRYTTSFHAAAFVVKLLTASPLVSVDGDGKTTLLLADQMRTDTDGLAWQFRVRPNIRFSNGNAVTAADVRQSLSFCRTTGWLAEVTTMEVEMRADVHTQPRLWVSITVDPQAARFNVRPRLAAELSHCPVYPRKLVELFGSLYGNGTNFGGVGPYIVTDFRPGRSVTLSPNPHWNAQSRTRSRSTVRLAAAQSDKSALSALRYGSFDIIFLKGDQQVLENARKDETLYVQKCSIYMVVSREGLMFPCAPERGDVRVGYVEHVK